MQSCNNIWLGVGTLYAATPGQSLGIARIYIYIYICVCVFDTSLSCSSPFDLAVSTEDPRTAARQLQFESEATGSSLFQNAGSLKSLMKWSVAEDSSWSSRAKSTSMPGRAVGLLRIRESDLPDWKEGQLDEHATSRIEEQRPWESPCSWNPIAKDVDELAFLPPLPS